MNISRAIIAVTATACAVSGCGYRVGAHHGDTPPDTLPVTATVAASVRTEPEALPPVEGSRGTPMPPPNAQGDPACASPLAWGRQPQGRGVLVSVWAETQGVVTVLVRTVTGSDVAERAALDRHDLRLFEFPEVKADAVREVLIMTNTARCFAVVDPVTFR